MRIPVIIICSVLLIGCSGKGPDVEDYKDTQAETVENSPTDENQRSIKYVQWSKKIDEQFWPFCLDEFELQEDEADVVSGLGGRWITVRYLLREDANVTREEIEERITQTFEFYEWKQTSLPEGKYVLSKVYETAKDDLCFTRGPFTSDDPVHFYNISIHISDNAGVLVLYCEAGW